MRKAIIIFRFRFITLTSDALRGENDAEDHYYLEEDPFDPDE